MKRRVSVYGREKEREREREREREKCARVRKVGL